MQESDHQKLLWNRLLLRARHHENLDSRDCAHSTSLILPKVIAFLRQRLQWKEYKSKLSRTSLWLRSMATHNYEMTTCMGERRVGVFEIGEKAQTEHLFFLLPSLLPPFHKPIRAQFVRDGE